MFLSEWRVNFLRHLALQGGGPDDSSRLDVVEIEHFLDMLPRAVFLPGRFNDLSAPRYLHVRQFVAFSMPKRISHEKWSQLEEFRTAIICEFDGG